MKKPGVVPGFDDSRQAPDGANPRRGALPCLAMHSPTKLRMALLSHTTLCCTAPHTALLYPV